MGLMTRTTDAFRVLTGKQLRFAYAPGMLNIPPGWNMQRYLQAYGEIGWLFGCVSRISAAVADTKWHLYSIQGGERREIDKHPLLFMLNYVNKFQTGQELFELSQMSLDLVGECFWVLNRNKTGRPAEVWVAPANRMWVVPSREQFITGYVYQWGGVKMPLEVEEVIHIMYPNPANPYRGIGPAQSIAVDLDSEKYSASFNRNFFFNNADPGTVLEIEGTITSAERDRIKEEWESQHRGVARAHKLAILQGGAKFSRTLMSQKDMDFWRLRKVNREVILGAYGIPASILGIEGPGSRARAEADAYIFARYVVRPRLTRIREKLNERLCPMFGPGLELDYDDPVPENREQIILEAESGIKAGYMTINEARQLVGLDAVKSGDVFIIPMTVMPMPVKGLPVNGGNGADTPGVFLLPIQKVDMAEEDKEAFWRGYAARTERQEKAFKKELKRLFDEQAEEVILNLEDAKSADDALFDDEVADETFQQGFRPVIEAVFISAGDRPLQAPVHQDAKQGFPLDEAALEWLETRSLTLAKMVNGTTREHLRQVLADGFREGESIPKLTKRIKEFYHNGYEKRAPMVARTEVISASNEGSLWRYEKEDVEQVEFYPALDERTCDICLGMANENPYVTKDSSGLIPVHVFCRCVWLPID